MITSHRLNIDSAAVRQAEVPKAVRFWRMPLDDDLPITADAESLLEDHPIRFLHQHQCAEIGLCVEGSGVFVVGEKVMEFGPGDVTFISHTEVHLARSMPGTTSRWHWIYLDPLRLTRTSPIEHTMINPTSLSGAAFRNVVHETESPHLVMIAARIVEELKNREQGYATSLIALVAQFMVLMHRARPSVDGPNLPGKGSQLDRIAPAIALVARNFADPLSVDQLARACAMSAPTLRRAFDDAMECSPREYWTDVRMQMAASMLRSTSLTVAAISRTVGFTTLSSFNRLFLQRFGATPRVWRQNSSDLP